MSSKLKTTKIGIVTSRGGHLFQMYRLKPWWGRHDRFWVTFSGDDTGSMLKGERVYYAYQPESRNAVNAIRNLFLARTILSRERPDVLISCGAGIAPPFFYAGKLMGMKLVWMEPYDFIASPSLSGRLVAPVADELLVQHEEQRRFYKRAVFRGAVL